MGFRCRPAAERPLPLHGSRSGGRTHGSARALEGLSLAGALARGKRLVAEQAPSVYAALRGRFLELHRYGLRKQAVLRLSRARSRRSARIRARPMPSRRNSAETARCFPRPHGQLFPWACGRDQPVLARPAQAMSANARRVLLVRRASSRPDAWGLAHAGEQSRRERQQRYRNRCRAVPLGPAGPGR